MVSLSWFPLPTSTPILRSLKRVVHVQAKKAGRNLLMVVVSRQFLDNFDNIQVLWGKLGLKMSNERNNPV
jgi:2-iminoacetate synthase ThiH